MKNDEQKQFAVNFTGKEVAAFDELNRAQLDLDSFSKKAASAFEKIADEDDKLEKAIADPAKFFHSTGLKFDKELEFKLEKYPNDIDFIRPIFPICPKGSRPVLRWHFRRECVLKLCLFKPIQFGDRIPPDFQKRIQFELDRFPFEPPPIDFPKHDDVIFIRKCFCVKWIWILTPVWTCMKY